MKVGRAAEGNGQEDRDNSRHAATRVSSPPSGIRRRACNLGGFRCCRLSLTQQVWWVLFCSVARRKPSHVRPMPTEPHADHPLPSLPFFLPCIPRLFPLLSLPFPTLAHRLHCIRGRRIFEVGVESLEYNHYRYACLPLEISVERII